MDISNEHASNMDMSEDEIFMGPITAKELQYLYKKKIKPNRKSGKFLMPVSDAELPESYVNDENVDPEEAEICFMQHDNEVNEVLIANSSLRMKTRCSENVSTAHDHLNKAHSETNESGSKQESEDLLFMRNRIHKSPNTKLTKHVLESALNQSSPLRSKLSENLSSPHVSLRKESLSLSKSELQRNVLEKRNISSLAREAESKPGSLSEACSAEFKNMMNSSYSSMEQIRGHETLLDTFDDLHLVSIPPGGDFTLTPDKTRTVQISPLNDNHERRTFQRCTNLFDLKEDKELDNSDEQFIPPTPCNTTVESGTHCSKLSSSDEQCIPETPRNSVEYNERPPILNNLDYICNNNDPYVDLSILNDKACKVLRKDANTSLFSTSAQKAVQKPNHSEYDFSAPTPCNSAAEISEKNFEISNTEGNSLFADEDDINIITINAGDDTNLSVLALAKEFSDENNIPRDYTEKDSVHESSRNEFFVQSNKMKVPEMTEEQRNMLRQLWCSPQSEIGNTSSGSPLMDALDLSGTNEVLLVAPTGPKSSLATLDLSVDDRIPVMSYINNSRFASVENPISNLASKSEERQLFRQKKTPMKLLSNKVGIVNFSTVSSSPNKDNENSKRTARDVQFTPVKGTARHSGIPVSQSSATKPPRGDFKNPNFLHGISTYRSRAPPRGKFFSTPTNIKTWNVKSPVAKYINEDPVQPLVKIVRPKEQRTLPIKAQASTPSKVAVTVPPSPEKVPVAHYKLQQTISSDNVVAGVSKEIIKPGRLFPSPYTPKVTRHEGAKKGIPGASHLNSKHLSCIKSSNTSDAKLNKSTIEPVVLQRTNTLFKPIA